MLKLCVYVKLCAVVNGAKGTVFPAQPLLSIPLSIWSYYCEKHVLFVCAKGTHTAGHHGV